MKKLVLLIAMTSLLLVACGDSNAKLNVANYSHEVNNGYMFTDQQGNDIFIDYITLESVGANIDDKLNITYDNNGYEIESIEIVEVN